MEKITKKSMFEAISEAMETGSCKFGPEVVQEFCAKEIELLEKKALKAKERAATQKKGADELTETVFDQLTDDEFMTIAQVTAAIGDEDITAAKVVYRLNALFKDGRVEKGEITIPGGDGQKSRRVNGYRKIA